MDFDEWERELDCPAGERVPDSWRDDARGGMVVVTLAVAAIVFVVLAVGWAVLR